MGRTHTEPAPTNKLLLLCPAVKGVIPPRPRRGKGTGRVALVRRLRTGNRTIPKAAKRAE